MMLYQQEKSDLKFILNYIPLFTLLSLEMGCHIAQFVLAPNAEWGKTFSIHEALHTKGFMLLYVVR